MNYSEKINDVKKYLQSAEFKGELTDALICTDIALSLRKLRIEQGVTQKALAEKLGLSQSHIARWERPGYQGYKVKMLNKIIRTLGGKLSIEIKRPNSSPSYVIYWSAERKDNRDLVHSYTINAYLNSPYYVENIV